MTAQNDARSAILQSIRASLTASAPHDAVYAEIHAADHGNPSRGGIQLPLAPHRHDLTAEWLPDVTASPIAQFGARLEAVGGEWMFVATLAEARDIVFALLRGADAHHVLLSDSPYLRAVFAAGEEPLPFEFLTAPSQTEMFAADAGISSAQWAIAESGTLVLESSQERNRLASLIPPIHVALVPTARLCGTLGEVLAKIHESGEAMESRAVTFVTGPSRTADIEQMLVMGVHGPQRLFVILVQDGATATSGPLSDSPSRS